ncbi:Transcriptional regulator, TetR family [Acidipropionibacterium acidipropionici ATCC 4875]|uniref:Transcriptional regulator, TetR family n=2 Tax=Acidipropionibacterium acidipropionici TaxID=1748 RepID=K7RR94_ACIA4|nr:Transcriptional regulator, TetR family [Acidipropionibacterium acidipropionici ATCC 4875]
MTDPTPENAPQAAGRRHTRVRMTSAQRRDQLIGVARGLFAANGVDGTTVEEIASTAQVSKPVVYEHFGSKDGLYAVVVDREVQRLQGSLLTALTRPHQSPRSILESGVFALLDYIDAHPDGFRIISRDSSVGSSTGSYASILSDVAAWVEGLLAEDFGRHGYDPAFAGIYAQALTGMVGMAGQSWLDDRQPSKEVMAAHLVDLAFNGLARLSPSPHLTRGTARLREE